jgi:hypothetical protein
VFWFSLRLLCETLLILRRSDRDIIINVHRSSCKVPVICMKRPFSNRFSKNTQVLNFVKIRPVGVELFHTDGQTLMMKLIVAFCNFANAPKHISVHIFWTWKPGGTFSVTFIIAYLTVGWGLPRKRKGW